jgi:DNA polymerase
VARVVLPMVRMRAARVADRPTLESLRDAAARCRACDLWQVGTQTVFGEGSARARIVFVGEQPGDEEDRTGRPFVGPAGRLLDDALDAAGIDRRTCYVTNVVKHFKWEPRGNRRIHQKPNAREVAACRQWLDAELTLLHPRALVCLGATAAKALLGPTFKVTAQHGRPVESALAPIVVATTHPSAVLRMPDARARHQAMKALIDDLRVVARLVAKG